MTQQSTQAVDTARQYYNSDDADNFYFTVWGGEDIHVGLYQSETEPIRPASRRTVETLAGKLQLNQNSRVLDVGAGFGGAMRYLAKTYGCKCTALNLSEKENQRDRQMNKEQGLDKLIEVVDGDFANLNFEDESFDAAWSQDAILHSGDRDKVISEVARILKPGGKFVFTDPMQADDAPTEKLQPIYDRINLSSLASPRFYKQQGENSGFKSVSFEDHTDQLTLHYARVLEELNAKEQKVKQAGVSQEYIDKMKIGLGHWVDGGEKGYLAWGIFEMVK